MQRRVARRGDAGDDRLSDELSVRQKAEVLALLQTLTVDSVHRLPAPEGGKTQFVVALGEGAAPNPNIARDGRTADDFYKRLAQADEAERRRHGVFAAAVPERPDGHKGADYYDERADGRVRPYTAGRDHPAGVAGRLVAAGEMQDEGPVRPAGDDGMPPLGPRQPSGFTGLLEKVTGAGARPGAPGGEPLDANRTARLSDELYKSMKGAGTDEDALYGALQQMRSDHEWAAVQLHFCAQFPTFNAGNLRRSIADELSPAELQHARDILYRLGVDWDYADTDNPHLAEIAKRGESREVTEMRQKNEMLVRKIREEQERGRNAQDPRFRSGLTLHLVRRRVDLRRRQRKIMTEVIDTAAEKLKNAFQQNTLMNKAEAWMEKKMQDKAGDAIGALEADVGWGTMFKARGHQMEQKLRRDFVPVGAMVRPTKQPKTLTLEFGNAMRELYFTELPEGYLDGATAGATPVVVQVARDMWDRCNQKNPVMWRFKSLVFRVKQAEAQMSLMLQADPDDTKIILNGRHGVATVLRGLPWEAGDRIMTFSTASDQTKNNTRWLLKRHGVEIIELPLNLPMTDDEIIDTVLSTIKDIKRQDKSSTSGGASGQPYFKDSLGKLPKVACIDHVTPREGWEMPINRLCSMLHDNGISVLVDGSLAIGQLDINCGQIGADWYVGAAHHFLYTCPGVGFLVVPPHKQPEISMPLTVSYFDGQGFGKEFEYYGLQCFSTWCSVLEAREFHGHRACGSWDDIRRHMFGLARDACRILSDAWGVTAVQLGRQDDAKLRKKKNPCLSIPVFPFAVQPQPPWGQADNEVAARISEALAQRGVYVKVFAAGLDGKKPGDRKIYVRVSCQIWNTVADIHRLAAAGKQIKAAGLDSLRTVPPGYDLRAAPELME